MNDKTEQPKVALQTRPKWSCWSSLFRATQRWAAVVEEYNSQLLRYVFVLVTLLLIGLSVLSSRGGYAHPELEQYIPHYLSHQSLLYKIFDFNKVEIFPVYRPRPLSYLVDYLDVSFIAWSARNRFPHLLSLSYYVFWFGDVLLLWYYFWVHLRMPYVTCGLLTCLFSTDSVVFFNGGYFRSAKPGATFFLLCSFVIYAECFRPHLPVHKLRYLAMISGAAMLLFCAFLFDEIPVAFAVSAAAILLTEWVLDGTTSINKRSFYILTSIMVVLICFGFYDFVLHPRLILAITAEEVSMAYQTNTAAALRWNPMATFAGALSTFFSTFSYLLGSISEFLAAVAFFGLVSFWDRPLETRGISETDHSLPSLLQKKRYIVLIMVGFCLMVLCLYGMISRHHHVMRITARQAQYFLPLTAVFLVFVAGTLAILVSKEYLSSGQVQIGLILLIASNLFFVSTQRVFNYGDPFTEMMFSMLYKSSATIPDLSGDQVAQLRREVSKSKIYQSLRSAMAGDR